MMLTEIARNRTRHSNITRLAIVVLLLLMTAWVAQATTLNINATEDTTVIQAFPTTNAGTDKELVVGTGGTGSFRIYLNFSNLTELHGKIITDAKINLTVNRSGSGGHADSIDMYRLFNTSWSENTTTWNNQPSENNTNHTSDLFVWNSTDYRTLNYSLFDVRQAIGYAAARNQTSIGFVFVRNTTTINRLTYFNSLNNGSAQVPRLEITYEDVQNYTIDINASNQMSHPFGMGLTYYYTNGTGDQSNITSALSEIAGDTVMTMLTWDNVEPSNATPADLSTLNWSGFNFNNGREDELYNGEWHNYTFFGAIQTAKNVSTNTTLLIHAARPPSWIKNASTGTKWYPFEDSSTHENVYYFWKMVLKYAIENASYPANRIIIKPINEPYGNTNTSVGTYVERLDNYGEILRGAYDAVQEVNSSVRIIGLDDNDPALGLTEDLFARNATLAKYLTGGISFHNYLHGDTGYHAWDDDGTPRPNPYNREWELLYQNYLVPQCRALLVGNASLAANQCWLTENSDKYLVHNDGTGSGNIKIYNTTNDALWIAARLSALSQQDLNVTMFWVLQPVPNVNGYDAGDTIDLGYGFMESFQNNWTKYEAYNVSKMYDNHVHGNSIINISNNTLNDNYIFVGAFTRYRRVDIFITNFRNSSSNISLNLSNLSFPVNNRRIYNVTNATNIEDAAFTSTAFNYTVPENSSYLIELYDNSTFIPPSPISLANTTGNYWVNHTWAAGAGNTTDSFNVSQNGTWTNGSTNTYFNASVGPSGWSNITVFAWNNSGTGTLSLTGVSMNTQAPAAPAPEATTRWDTYRNDTSTWELLGSFLKLAVIILIIVCIIGAIKGKIKAMDAITIITFEVIILIVIYTIIPIIGSLIGRI